MKDSALITELLHKVEKKESVIENQAKVIKENWSELQSIKRVLIEEHPDVWEQIKSKTS